MVFCRVADAFSQQEGLKRLEVSGGVSYQIDLGDVPPSNPLGPMFGLGYVVPAWGRPLQLGAQVHYFNSSGYGDLPNYHYYQGWSLKVSGVYLYRISRLGKGELLAGPGIAYYQHLGKANTSDYAPDFGVLGRVYYRISGDQGRVNLFGDFDFITSAGFFRTTVGVSYCLFK